MSVDPAPHGAPSGSPSPDDRLASILSTAQFLVTGVVLLVIATLAYVAGMHSAKGGGHGTEPAGRGGENSKVDVALFLHPTPELIAEGKAAFVINCASCHGTLGHGDGPAAMALNPKPRNFTEGYWRYGGGFARIVRTISEGSPGTGMASFKTIPLDQRMAIAHYIRTFGPKLEDDKPEDLVWLQPAGAPGTGGTDTVSAGGAAPAPGPTIPLERAMAALVEAEPPVGTAGSAASTESTEAGAALYAERCARCHGAAGEGGIRVRMLGSAPYAYVVTRSFGAPKGDWAVRFEEFERIVLMGLPGYAMPANGDLSRGDLRDLYLYTQKLRARQDATRPSSS